MCPSIFKLLNIKQSIISTGISSTQFMNLPIQKDKKEAKTWSFCFSVIHDGFFWEYVPRRRDVLLTDNSFSFRRIQRKE